MALCSFRNIALIWPDRLGVLGVGTSGPMNSDVLFWDSPSSSVMQFTVGTNNLHAKTTDRIHMGNVKHALFIIPIVLVSMLSLIGWCNQPTMYQLPTSSFRRPHR